jgi:hypothetical protein
MDHAIATRSVIIHAAMHRKDLYMDQIDLFNSFGPVPHDLIRLNMAAIGLSATCIQLVKNIYTDNSSKITPKGGDTQFIQGQSGTVQACPLSPALFKICWESFLRRIKKREMLKLGYAIKLESSEEIKINAEVYVERLILWTETHDDVSVGV